MRVSCRHDVLIGSSMRRIRGEPTAALRRMRNSKPSEDTRVVYSGTSTFVAILLGQAWRTASQLCARHELSRICFWTWQASASRRRVICMFDGVWIVSTVHLDWKYDQAIVKLQDCLNVKGRSSY